MRKAVHRVGWVGALAAAVTGWAACRADRPLTPSASAPEASVSDEPVVEASAPATTAVVAQRTPPPDFGRACRIDPTQDIQCTWWQDPDPALICCDGLCENTHDDPWNCGACGIVCGAGQICSDGKCGAPVVPAASSASATRNPDETIRSDCTANACAAGQICCGGICVAPSWDTENCGGCGVACRFVGAICALGGCCPGEAPDDPCHTRTCPKGQVFCDPACKDIGADPDNCGGCGALCPESARHCVSGVCLSR